MRTCPFCGVEVVFTITGHYNKYYVYLGCDNDNCSVNCFIEDFTRNHDDLEEIQEKIEKIWDTRHAES